MRRGPRIILAACVGAAALAYSNRDGLFLAAAISTAEARPGLLADAQWDCPDTAIGFRKRFHAGAAEHALVGWLNANRFAVDLASGQAVRRVKSMPCNESIHVIWTGNPDGSLVSADATVTEAGCL